jgi:hypothetical protein
VHMACRAPCDSRDENHSMVTKTRLPSDSDGVISGDNDMGFRTQVAEFLKRIQDGQKIIYLHQLNRMAPSFC